MKPDPMPDVFKLGLALSATDAEHARLDADPKARATRPWVNVYLDMLSFRGAALRDLISTLPAKTMADAAVQIEVGTSFACGLEASDIIGDRDYRTRMEVAALERILYSVLPHVAGAAGIDMAAMGWDFSARLRTLKFTGRYEE